MNDYHIIITDAGAALEAEAHAAGEPVALTAFSVCDGGAAFTPDPAQTTLDNEIDRWDISSLSVSPDDASLLVAQCIIPASSGGYTIRGIGIYAGETLYAVGNYPDQPKPAPDSGYAASLEILVQLAVSDTADVTLHVTDGSWMSKAEADRTYVPLERKINGHALSEDTDITADDVGAYSKEESDTRYAINVVWGNVGEVGTYAFLSSDLGGATGVPVEGSTLYAAGVGAPLGSWAEGYSILHRGGAMSGTWVCCGRQPGAFGDSAGATLFYRIA